MHNIDPTIDDDQTPPPEMARLETTPIPHPSGAIAGSGSAQPYGLLGLCLSLFAILFVTIVYAALAGGLALLVDGLSFGWTPPLDRVRQLEAESASNPALALHLGLGISLAVYLALSLAVLTLARLRGGSAWRQIIGWRPWPVLKTRRAFWFIVGAALIYGIAANLLVGLYYPPSKDWFTVPKEGLAAFMLFVLAVVFAPLTEELLFRGWIYTSLRASFGLWTALLVSAALFAGAHYESSHIYALVVFPIGLALGGMREATGTLKASISFHAFYNAIAFGLALFDIG
ncbi:CPBP family intramembrane glutamic endopeptidase [Methyloferula stellata]|uniref:CPBP family intramembrane glutamic endopeptidase n=1 Tax=Methyloferula stellata TaxID=876270 RepID=UPI00036B9B0B|nr:type II CAAX endopeptidase family protein [Methyloferula stellata]